MCIRDRGRVVQRQQGEFRFRSGTDAEQKLIAPRDFKTAPLQRAQADFRPGKILQYGKRASDLLFHLPDFLNEIAEKLRAAV